MNAGAHKARLAVGSEIEYDGYGCYLFGMKPTDQASDLIGFPEFVASGLRVFLANDQI